MLGWPYPKRIKHLQELTAGKTERTHAVRFQGKLQYMGIHAVPIELPKYRLENGRTAAAQIEYLAKNPKVDRDIFTKDSESDTAQALQHELLKGMLDESGLFEYFESHDQEIPLILTNYGFVVNGNRRLCAMRELHKADEVKFERFKHVDVVILPPCDERDIDWLEGKEQIHRDITARYSWTATAIMYRRRMKEHNFKEAELASLYEVDKDEVTDLLDLLSHAELYLKDRSKEGRFSELDKDEFAFRQLRKNRTKLKTEADKEVYDQLCYVLIDKPLGDRSYQSVADVSKYFDRVVKSIRTELNVESKDKAPKTTLLGTSGEVAADILPVVSDSKRHDEVRAVIRDVIDSEKAKARDLKKANYVLTQVRKAATALQDALSAADVSASKEGISDQLTSIDETLSKLRKWLNG